MVRTPVFCLSFLSMSSLPCVESERQVTSLLGRQNEMISTIGTIVCARVLLLLLLLLLLQQLCCQAVELAAQLRERGRSLRLVPLVAREAHRREALMVIADGGVERNPPAGYAKTVRRTSGTRRGSRRGCP